MQYILTILTLIIIFYVYKKLYRRTEVVFRSLYRLINNAIISITILDKRIKQTNMRFDMRDIESNIRRNKTCEYIDTLDLTYMEKMRLKDMISDAECNTIDNLLEEVRKQVINEYQSNVNE